MDNPYVLPPLPERPRVQPKGRVETLLDGLMARSLLQQSWSFTVARFIGTVMLLFWSVMDDRLPLLVLLALLVTVAGVHRIARLTLHFGHVSPYVMRPWYWLSDRMRRGFTKIKFETVRTLFFRRVFSLHRIEDKVFRPGYAVVNWLCFLVFLWVAPAFLGDLIEGVYAYGTYPFGTYENVVVTQTYPNAKMHGVAEQNTFSVHGYITEPNGETKEIYLTLGPNIWFWDLVPEFLYGQIPVSGRCTFYTYGWMVRIPTRLRIFSAGALYALNPWIVGIKNDHCTAPTNVPSK